MIPVKLKIEGFLSYRQPVELDFTGFDLACISGPNGAGKSSLLDAITWVLFGQARQRDESIINNNPAVKAAMVTLDFDYENDRYRVQRSNPRGKTTMVEFFIRSQGDGDNSHWKPLTERTMRETDQKIQNILKMDFDTFTNASFFLQGKADQFATARPAERKRILSNILGLDKWETYREATRGQRSLKEKELRELEGRLSEIQSELDEEAERKARLAELQIRLADLEKQRISRAKNLENVRRLHTALEEQGKNTTLLRNQLEGSKEQYERILSTLEQRLAEKTEFDVILVEAESIKTAYEDWRKLRDDLGEMEEVAAAYHQHEALRQEPLRIIQAEEARLIQEKQGLEAQKSALDGIDPNAENLKVQLSKIEEVIQTTEEKISRREALSEEIRLLQQQYAEAKAENPRLKTEMEELKERIDKLQDADGAACPLCAQPLSENERTVLIASLNESGKNRADRYRQNKQLLEDFEGKLQKKGAELADLKSADTSLRTANRQVDQINNQLLLLEEQKKDWQDNGGPRLSDINEALKDGNFALESRKQLAGIENELEALGYDLRLHAELRSGEQAGRQAEGDLRKLEQAQAALEPLTREIKSLEQQRKNRETDLEGLIAAHDDAAAKLAAAELPNLAAAESELFDYQEQENRVRQEFGGAAQKVAVLERIKARKVGYLEDRDQTTHYIADLKQLERAFGKDGVPALLIEQALPEIEEITNDLLSRLTSGRMSFKFQTQREYRDTKREDKKETLDMVISDTVGIRDYELFSGGEAFRINFSIRLALSEVLARRAGARLQTLVIDEGFGSQDEEGRQRLIEAINMVRNDFEKILVITHLEELKEAFPTRIEVEKTIEGSRFQVV